MRASAAFKTLAQRRQTQDNYQSKSGFNIDSGMVSETNEYELTTPQMATEQDGEKGILPILRDQ